MKTLALAAMAAAFAAFADEPMLPGYLTDPTANWKDLAADGSATPATLRYPYLAVHSVKPTIFVGETCRLGWYVTDFDHSLVRFGDKSKRFDVELRLTLARVKFKSFTKENVPSGDGEFVFSSLPVGTYYAGLSCTDRETGLRSHTVWQEFRVVEKDFGKIPADKVVTVTDDMLKEYGIVADPGYERLVPVELGETYKEASKNAGEQKLKLGDYMLRKVEAYLAEHPHQDSAGVPGYAVYVPAHDGEPLTYSFAGLKVVYDAAYSRDAIVAQSETNSVGFQKMLDEAKTNGFQKLVMKPGRYRVSHKYTLAVPDRFTFDLGGATLKLNGFIGCKGMMVRLGGVNDSHFVNGTLEGDYFEHDYKAEDSKGSEWVCGAEIRGLSRNSSIEEVKFVNITGYGACVSSGREGAPTAKGNPYYWMVERGAGLWSEKNRPVALGAVRIDNGEIDTSDTNQWHTGFVDISHLVPYAYFAIGHFGGYQGNRLKGWNYAVAFYDEGTNFISGEIAAQFRQTLLPARTKFLRLSIGASSPEEIYKSQVGLQLTKYPRNCSIERCLFDRVRAVGMVPCHSEGLRVIGNEFRRSGESLAKCAFDAEDGWETVHDMLVEGNWFHDNPNSEFLTCAGFNFQIINNRMSMHLYGRTHSSYVASNVCDVLNVCGESRKLLGYTRIIDNQVNGCINLGGYCKDYIDWDVVVDGLTFKSDGSDKRFAAIGGPCGRYRNCTFEGVDARVAAAENCVFRNCRPKIAAVRPNGRWTDCRMESSQFSAYLGTMFFIRCAFSDSRISANNATYRFDDCEFLEKTSIDPGVMKTATFNNCKGLDKK